MKFNNIVLYDYICDIINMNYLIVTVFPNKFYEYICEDIL